MLWVLFLVVSLSVYGLIQASFKVGPITVIIVLVFLYKILVHNVII